MSRPPVWWPWNVPLGWELWEGVTGAYYARLLMSSPPIVLRAAAPAGLRQLVADKRDELATRWAGQPVR